MDLKDVLKRIKLTDEEYVLVKERIAAFISKLTKKTKRLSVKIVLGGSAAKGTLIRGDFDCDVFVCFSRIYRETDISRLLGKSIAGLKPDGVHGSRDYFRLAYEGMMFEIVPVLEIENPAQALNVTDMSPLHVGWIEKRIQKNKRLRDEIMIAKQFCKAQRVYGAESYIGGFSGHVLDILLVRYGSFVRLAKSAAGWKPGLVIDVEGYGSASDLNKSKFSPLIVIDPVDPSRNAAAALTLDRFTRFQEACASFNRRPSLSCFERKHTDKESLRRLAGKRPLAMVRAFPLEGKIDVVGAKLMKIHGHILAQLQANGFKVLEEGWVWDKSGPALMWYILKENILPSRRLHWGPPIDSPEAGRFRKLYKRTKVSGGRLNTSVLRKHRTAASLIRSTITGDYVRERSSKAQYLY